MHLKEIILTTSLLEEQKNFYENVLEMNINSKTEDSFKIKTPGTMLVFMNVSDSEKPFYHFAFNIPENQFKEAKQWALKRVNLIKLDGNDEFDFKSWNAHSIYFCDPAGNIVELIARHNLNNKSQENFTGKSLLNISEIGLPAYNVKEVYNILKNNLNISLFSGDLETFTAVGDDTGLFIIVPQGRKWFPNCEKAQIFPLTIHILSHLERQIEFTNLPYKIVALAE